MSDKNIDKIITPKLTLIGEALKELLIRTEIPVVSSYQIFIHMRTLYNSGQKLWLRKKQPDRDELKKVRDGLIGAKVLIPDEDFKQGIYRVVQIKDRSAEEICGIVEPFCYISHLSAMARYGLSDRRSKSLQLTIPDAKTGKHLWNEKVFEKDYTAEERRNLSASEIFKPMPRSVFPEKVRKQEISIKRTAHLGSSQPIKGSFAKIETIGHVFASMLEDPNLCGGMKHIIDVWEEHANTYLNDIIEAVESRPKGITKVRAGYLLDELLGIKNTRIESWTQYAQRGGSRLLDPSSPSKPTFSEKWMLSLNA